MNPGRANSLSRAFSGEEPLAPAASSVLFNEKLWERRRETMFTDLKQRVRDVRQGPDGLLYVMTDEDDGAVLRIEPIE